MVAPVAVALAHRDREVTQLLLTLTAVERGEIWVVHRGEYRRVRPSGVEPRVTDPPLPDRVVQAIHQFVADGLVHRAGSWPMVLRLTTEGRRHLADLRAGTDTLTSAGWLETLYLAGVEAMMPWADMFAPRVTAGPTPAGNAEAPLPDQVARRLLIDRLRTQPGRWLCVYYGAKFNAQRLRTQISSGRAGFGPPGRFLAWMEPLGSDYAVYACANANTGGARAAAISTLARDLYVSVTGGITGDFFDMPAYERKRWCLAVEDALTWATKRLLMKR